MSGPLLALVMLLAQSGTTEEVYRPYTESPRLFLNAQRLRLLQRESERKSLRWEQFQTLIGGGANMPEPGFAYGLHALVTKNPASAKKAIDWALTAAGPIRQIALVYDWCRPSLTPAQSKALEAKLMRAARATDPKIPAVRDRVLAALAIADVDFSQSERAMRAIVKDWWRNSVARSLGNGQLAIEREDTFALYEILHAVRDNLQIDLREDARDYFKSLPGYYLLSHYPAPLPAAENAYRVPVFPGPGEPDVKAAVLSRAAGLSMVAYDNNATDSQFLQGWLLMDHFLMRSTLGIAYEFLWANPYQPGLSYYHFPLFHHDPSTGRLFIRSSWEEDATWFGIVSGQMQLFANGNITLLNPKLKQQPIEIGASKIVVASTPLRFEIESPEATVTFVVGLKPRARYKIEVDDEELTDDMADPAGTLSLSPAAGTRAGVRITEDKP